MFGISSLEALIIIAVAIIIFKPKDLVGLVAKIAKIIGNIRDFFNKIGKEVEQINVLSQLEDFIAIPKNTNSKDDNAKSSQKLDCTNFNDVQNIDNNLSNKIDSNKSKQPQNHQTSDTTNNKNSIK